MSDSDELLALVAQHDIDQTNGCCAFQVAGVELVADPSGVCWWPQERCLIVSDLHLEKGSSFARRGQMLPPYDTGATLVRLQRDIKYYQPGTVVSLGDSFHDRDASARLSLIYRQQLSELVKACDWLWITGNHDPEPPVEMPGTAVETLAFGPLHFCHEPDTDSGAGQISGHLHPKAKLVKRGRSIRRRCFATSRDRLILPAYGSYTGGLNVLDKAFDGLFDKRIFHALMLGEDQVYRIAGRDLSR